MTTYSLNELTDRMQGKSITLGWDALVFMNRAKVNSLLEQQYITRFNKDSFLKTIFGSPSMTPDGSEYLDLSGLILSQPRLSFEKASLRNSRVTATMDIVSGTVSYMRKGSNQVPAAILYNYGVSAHQGYTVTMEIDLAGSKGTVNEQGQVIVDIGEGYNCRCNLVAEDKSQELLGDFFKALFLEQKPEDRVYTLGMLDLRDVDLLAPRSFMIRTMATEEGKIRTSDSYGEGAVVLLVRTKGNPVEGNDPAEGALDYLIPNDRDVTGKEIYSGALVLASRVVFDWYIQYPIQDMIGNGIFFERVHESGDIARSLKAVAGSLPLPGYYHRWRDAMIGFEEVASVGGHALQFAGIDNEALRIAATQQNTLAMTWTSMQQKQPFVVTTSDLGIISKYHSNGEARADVNVEFSPIFKQPNTLVFEAKRPTAYFPSDYTAIRKSYTNIEFHQKFGSDYLPELDRVLTSYASFFGDAARFKSFGIPEINAVAISNLLFPERNALQLTEARLPGDLAMFGHIDPKETSFTLDPLMPAIKAGDKQTFTIRQLGIKAQDVTWSVRSVDGARAMGTIDTNGEYTAPAIQLLEGSAARNVVTASYKDASTGEEVTASALVTVTLAGLVVTPSMALVEMSRRDKTVTLKATSLKPGPIKWTPRGSLGTLVPNGNEAIYTPPQTNLPDGTLQAVEFEVENTDTGEKAIATVLLRQGLFAMNIQPAIVPGLRPNSSTLLKPPSNLQPSQLKWEVVAGGGSIDGTTGIFTAPARITIPYSIVKATYEDVVTDTLGYSIIHLSEHAPMSSWEALSLFEFEVLSPPTRVYANGLQQARVVVRVQPTTPQNAPEAELSEAERNSIRLVSADEKNPLPEVGDEGVPVGSKWHFNATENNYKKYQDMVFEGQPTDSVSVAPKIYVKEFFVQCHKVEDLRISAYMRSDDRKPFYSNPSPDDDENNKKVLALVAVPPPLGGPDGGVLLSFGNNPPIRVKGDKDNDVDLNTIDYYFLRLLVRNVQVAIRNIEFVGNSSMVKWESDTQLEDIHSITGYALPDDKNADGKQILHFDEIMMRRIKGGMPEQVVDPQVPVPVGQVLFSLHRREYWQHDKYVKSDFGASLNVNVFDEFGNKHNVIIGFDGIDRNKLRIIGS